MECAIEGCSGAAIKRGWCNKHYQRWQKTGDPEGIRRPDWWGERLKHPLWEKWQYHLNGSKTGLVPEWEGFDAFCAGVGEPPEPEGYQLRKVDASQPIGPDNFHWKKVGATQSQKQKDYRKRYPKRHRRYYLKRTYGVTLDWYEETLEAQGGGCAICGRTDPGNKAHKYLPVDHCHETGKVRAILCDPCNRALGYLGHDADLATKVAKYLATHSEET